MNVFDIVNCNGEAAISSGCYEEEKMFIFCKVWRENTLHEGQLNPALPFRDVFTWEHRKRDLDLRSKPERNFGMSMPETIMPAGDIKLQQERDVYNK